jgi:hypothetical protein
MLNIIDEFSRECLAIRINRKLKATDVIDALSDLFILRGIPTHRGSGNECFSKGLSIRSSNDAWRLVDRGPDHPPRHPQLVQGQSVIVGRLSAVWVGTGIGLAGSVKSPCFPELFHFSLSKAPEYFKHIGEDYLLNSIRYELLNSSSWARQIFLLRKDKSRDRSEWPVLLTGWTIAGA